MGQDVDRTEFTRQDRQLYRQKVRRCLDVFARMLSESKFDFDRPMTGLEIEFNLIDDVQDPAMRNSDVLHAIENPDFQTELGQFIKGAVQGLGGTASPAYLIAFVIPIPAELDERCERSRNYVSENPSDLRNFMSADTRFASVAGRSGSS